MVAHLTEYRINKKGAEFFRTRDQEQAASKLTDLQAKRPGVFSLQQRSVQLDRYGKALTDGTGKPMWTPWR